MTTLDVRVIGRPAPQGSHEVGQNGYVMHSSNYLEAWRHAVNRDTRKAYIAAGVTGDDMPLIPYPAPVYLTVWHVMLDEQCRASGADEPVGSPDVDKLLRATIDGLGEAHAFTNDSQVVHATTAKRRRAPGEDVGAYITISTERPEWPSAPSRGDQAVNDESFTHNGVYRLVLEKVGVDGDGDRSWETIVEVSDTAEAIRDTWLPSLGVRLGRELPAEPLVPISAPAEPEAPKPARKPRKAAEPAAAPAEAAPAAPAAPPSDPGAPVYAPAEQAPAQPVDAPAAPRVNPFAK